MVPRGHATMFTVGVNGAARPRKLGTTQLSILKLFGSELTGLLKMPGVTTTEVCQNNHVTQF